jgi:SAM-dependent methyltransferase
VSSGNAEQISYWACTGGPAWAASAGRMDFELAGLGLLAMDALALAPGQFVIDVGCGAGATSLQLARRVQPGGRVLGVDLSPDLLAMARDRAAASGLHGLHFIRADAQQLRLRGQADAAFSRFGVMFFADPVAAFTGLRGCLRPGGALAFACWQPPAVNPWFGATNAVVNAAAGVPAVPADPAAPGPFAFADPGRTRQVLHQAGWRDIGIEPQAREVALDDAMVSDRVRHTMARAPAALTAAPASVREQAQADVRAALEAFRRDGAVRLRQSVWIVTARA